MGVTDRCLMTWEKPKLRWRKMYKGKVYTVSCKELGVPENKEASYQAANAWWADKLIELQRTGGPSPVARKHITVEMIKKRLRWAEQNGRQDIAADYKERLTRAERIAAHIPSTPEEQRAWWEGLDKCYPFPNDMEERIRDAKALGMDVDAIRLPQLLDDLVGEGQVWMERFRTATSTKVPAEKSIGGLSQRFLALSAARVEGGELSASEHDLACRCVQHFVDWIGPGNEPGVITPEKWEAYWHHLRSMITAGTRSREYAKKDWRYARAFVEWLIGLDKMPALKNLHDKRYKIGETRKAIETFTQDEVKTLTEKAPGQLRLHLFLMLNCGFYQKDISDLLKDEVDLDGGYITRQRSKTRQHHGDKVPTVRYKLWPITLELLKVHLSPHPELALTTRQGKPWVEEKIEGNRVKSRRDGIKSNFAHLAKRLKIEKPLKSFRKTSSTRIEGNRDYKHFRPLFLGHAPKEVGEKHYADYSQGYFDEAVEWLGMDYGFIPSEEK